MDGYKPKTFWERPEGVTGAVFMVAIIAAIGFITVKSAALIVGALTSTIGLVATLAILGTIIFMAIDSKSRNLIWSRWI